MPLRATFWAWIIAAGLTAFAGPSLAGPDDLVSGFGATVASDPSDTTAAARKVIRSRLVSLDKSVLASRITPAGKSDDPSRLRASRELPDTISLSLFDDVSVTAKRRALDDIVGGGIAWTGEVQAASGFVVLVSDGENLIGTIFKDGHYYRIEPAAGALRVVEIMASAFPADRVVPPPGRAAQHEVPALADVEPRATTTIKVLAAYTSRSLADIGPNPALTIAADLAIANVALSNSGIAARFKLVGVKAVSSSFNEQAAGSPSANTFRALKKITSGKSDNFRAIRRKRNALKADLVTMYASTDPAATTTCGQAWLLLKDPVPQFGFSVVNSPCKGTITLAHELGHNLGADHDRFILLPATFSNSVFRFGYVDLANGFYDLMAYPNQCLITLVICTVVPYYSTPLRTYNGHPIGIAKGQPGAADASRRIRSKLSTVAGYR